MAGLDLKCNAGEILDRRRRFFRREMRDGILVVFNNMEIDLCDKLKVFDEKWGQYEAGAHRPFPSNEEVFEREWIKMTERGRVEDDWLPVSYSILDAGESMVGGMFGADIQFFHRRHAAAYSASQPIPLPDYSRLSDLKFSLNNPWTQRFLALQEYFERQAGERIAQHPCLTMDALNFAAEMRGATQAYIDIYEHPVELQQIMEIGLDFNIRFQEAQMERIKGFQNGSFVWLGQWVPFPKAISLSVDAYCCCAPASYVEFGFEYQSRLIRHFGSGLMHFHCNRTDLAAEVAKLPGLKLFQYGGDPHDPKPELDYLPEMRAIMGDIPIMASCALDVFQIRLAAGALPPNVWYRVNGTVSVEQANRLMDKVRRYRSANPAPGNRPARSGRNVAGG